jgi:hypothetical protein
VILESKIGGEVDNPRLRLDRRRVLHGEAGFLAEEDDVGVDGGGIERGEFEVRRKPRALFPEELARATARRHDGDLGAWVGLQKPYDFGPSVSTRADDRDADPFGFHPIRVPGD